MTVVHIDTSTKHKRTLYKWPFPGSTNLSNYKWKHHGLRKEFGNFHGWCFVFLEIFGKLWIGAVGHEESFEWVGLHTGPFSTAVTDWAVGEPNNRSPDSCVELNRNEKWNAQQCSDKNAFICERGMLCCSAVCINPFCTQKKPVLM